MNRDFLEQLTRVPGIASREDQIREVVIVEPRSLVDEIRIDVMGNVVATNRGNGEPRVMIAAHMDEIGFFVKHIDDHGFLRLQPEGNSIRERCLTSMSW